MFFRSLSILNILSVFFPAMENLTFVSILFSVVESLLHAHTAIKQRDDEHLYTVSFRKNVSNFRWLPVRSDLYYIDNIILF